MGFYCGVFVCARVPVPERVVTVLIDLNSLEAGFLTKPFQLGRLAHHSRVSSVSSPQMLGLQACVAMPGFYGRCGYARVLRLSAQQVLSPTEPRTQHNLGVSKTIYKAFNKSPTKLKQTQELD